MILCVTFKFIGIMNNENNNNTAFNAEKKSS